ncbi:hypothetical protein Hanom_Chr12g01074741 [Helianthus anomalus]
MKLVLPYLLPRLEFDLEELMTSFLKINTRHNGKVDSSSKVNQICSGFICYPHLFLLLLVLLFL